MELNINSSYICSPRSLNNNVAELFHSTKDKSWSIGEFLKTKTIIEVNHEVKNFEGILLYSNNIENNFVNFKRKRTENNLEYMYSNNSHQSNKKQNTKLFDIHKICKV